MTPTDYILAASLFLNWLAARYLIKEWFFNHAERENVQGDTCPSSGDVWVPALQEPRSDPPHFCGEIQGSWQRTQDHC